MSKERYDARNSGNSRTPELEGKLYTTKARKKVEYGGGSEHWKGEGMAFPVVYSYWKMTDFTSNLTFFLNIFFLLASET